MVRRYSLFTLLAILAGCLAAFAQALPEKVIDVGNATCPISGEKVAEGVVLLHEGKLYHFCCPACLETFQKDPAAAIAKIKDAQETPLTLTNVEGKCPVTGEAAKPDIFVVRDGTITFYSSVEAKEKDAAPAAAPAPADQGSAAPTSEGETCGDCSTCSGCPSGH